MSDGRELTPSERPTSTDVATSAPSQTTNAPQTTNATVETPPADASIDIVSSLEGIAVLPRRIRWTATVDVPVEQVQKVVFNVDRRIWWVDREPPYTYGPDGAYLVTSWMSESPRRHSFTISVVTSASTVSESVVARVRKAKAIDHEYGQWGKLSPAALESPPPPGEWRDFDEYTGQLNWETGWLWVGRSVERAFAYELAVDAKTFRVGSPIFIGGSGILLGWHFKGHLCAPDGPPATYAWSQMKGHLRGRSNGRNVYAPLLVLMAMKEPCKPRRRLLEGVWEGFH